MKHFYTLITILGATCYAQVGIGTTSPNAQLEIVASNTSTPTATDGLIIPRVTSLSATNPTASQHGMLIQLLNTSGGKSPGFYYWDNAVPDWIPFISSKNIGGFQDHDWYEQGSVLAPDNINDNMYHIGNTAIGKNTATAKLDILETTAANPATVLIDRTNSVNAAAIQTNFTVAGNSAYAMDNFLLGTGSATTIGGVHNTFNHDGTGTRLGVFNEFLAGSGPVTGIHNHISAPSTGEQISLYTKFAGNNSAQHFGVKIEFRGTGNGQNTGIYIENSKNGSGEFHGGFFEIGGTGNADKYGVQNVISGSGTGNKYGTHNFIDSAAGGTHYGVYSEALKINGYAGYFLGRFSIGTSTSNNYILPPSRGTNNQIMQTNGSGVVSWVDAGSVGSKQSISTVSTSTYNVAATDYTVRVTNSVSSVVLPNPATQMGKIYVLIGVPGITAKSVTTLSGIIFDDVTNTTITTLSPNQRYVVQSNGTNWYVIGN